jgi:type IV pilus assembly protein PilO
MNRLRNFNLDLLKSKVILATIGGVVVLLLVWWFAWMTPEASKLSTVQAQEQTYTNTRAELRLELATLKSDKAHVLREIPYLKKIEAAIPSAEDPPGIVDSLNSLARKTDCDLLSVTPADTPTASSIKGLEAISVSISVSGSHRNIFTFLEDFYSMKRLMTINSISLTPGGSSTNIFALNDGAQYSLSLSAEAYTTYATPGTAS